ncbi:alpha-ribazole phosphatase [mine drainage metagenome]|uniref:Alpha-ribazole phosphatase n=1 Tax=mine drainage metagenome TaxID=410659 RepID=A0A1J5SIA6_9ZZZZ
MAVILVRHTSVNIAPGICYGVSEVPLADTFQTEAERVHRALPLGPRLVVSSPSKRCLSLARVLAGDGPVATDPRLHELNFGAWEGRHWDDLPRADVDAWSADFVNRAPPGGESFTQLAARAEACLADLLQRHSGETLVLVTHGGVIRALLAPRSGLALRDAFSIPVDFGGVYPLVP